MSIQQRASFNVLVIGEKCDDIFVYGSTTRISPEAPIPVFEVSYEKTIPGMAANVKKNLEGLGIIVDMIANEKTIVKKRFVDRRYNQHLLRVDTGLTVDKIDVNKLNELQQPIDAIIISDYDKGFLPNAMIEPVLKILKIFNVPIFVDSKKRDLSQFEDCIIKVNEKEYNDAKHTLPKNSKVIVTLGAAGAMYKDVIYPVKKVDIFDVVGAGDTFISALAFKYLQTTNIDQSIIFANICSSFVVTKIGTYAIKLSDIEK